MHYQTILLWTMAMPPIPQYHPCDNGNVMMFWGIKDFVVKSVDNQGVVGWTRCGFLLSLGYYKGFR